MSAQFQALAGPIADFSFNLNVGAQRPPAAPSMAATPAASPSKWSAYSIDFLPVRCAHVPSKNRFCGLI